MFMSGLVRGYEPGETGHGGGDAEARDPDCEQRGQDGDGVLPPPGHRPQQGGVPRHAARQHREHRGTVLPGAEQVQATAVNGPSRIIIS